MRDVPSLMAYSVARLTMAMAVGIYLSDRLVGTMDVACCEWIVAALDFGVLMLLVAVFFAMIGIYRMSTVCYKGWFGILTLIAFCLFGGYRLIQERRLVDFEWSENRGVYWGEVMTPPVVKGKMLQAEVLVEAGRILADSADSVEVPAIVPKSSDPSSGISEKDLGDSVVVSTNMLTDVDVSSEIIKDAPACLDASVEVAEKTSVNFNASSFFPVHRRIILYWMSDSLQRPVVCGDMMLFAGEIARPNSEEELTGFDYADYLYRKGISATAMAFHGQWMVCERKGTLGIKQYALRCREWIVDQFRTWNLGSEELAVVAALTVGDKSVLTSSLKAMYSAAGVSHVLALSGLHIGIFSAVLYLLLTPLKCLRKGEQLRSFLVVMFLWAFAFITGLSPSVVRAVLMCSLYFIASCCMEGRFPSVYTLMLAAFFMLVYQPFYLFDLSFQLSFLAVASILYFYPPIAGWMTWNNKIVRWLWNGISVSLAAQLGTLPLVLYYFGTFPTYFLLSNLIVSVLAVCVLCGTVAALFVSYIPMVGSVAASWVICFLSWVTCIMNASIRWIQQLSGAQIDVFAISLLQSFCGFIFLIAFCRFLYHRRAAYLLWMLLAINVSLADWTISRWCVSPPSLYLWRSQLYLKRDHQLMELRSPNDFYMVDNLRIGILNDERWKKKKSQPLIPLDYLYLNRGFKGSVTGLMHVFHIRHLILDSSLSTSYRQFLQKECEKLKIPYTDISAKGSYRILL